jgi:phenylacetate-CoA ligase
VLIGAGTQLTPSLRQRLQSVYRVPIQQSYGLNEVGMVACRCDAGRYHVHTEHCLVEIVDEAGHACPAGKTGRLLVTALRNLAMPLIRYDTGDLAEAIDGPCPCGRVLPSFGEIAGRFRRYAGLPEGTRLRFRAIHRAIEDYPARELGFLRRHQVHQDRQNHFTLRLRVVGPIPEAFRAAVMRSWESVTGLPSASLAIVEVDEISPSASGKPLDFVSDFHDDPAVATPAGGGSGGKTRGAD